MNTGNGNQHKISPEADQKLIKRINRGDLEAFETLYHRYRDWVYSLAYRFTRDHEIAEDVLQETFTYLLKKFPGFRLTCRMTTFLYPTVKFTAVKMSQLHRKNAGIDEPPNEIPIPSVEQSGTSRSELARVFSSLSDAQREVVLMRFVDCLNESEIAKALNIPAGTVKSRLHNALQKLRQDERTRQYFLD